MKKQTVNLDGAQKDAVAAKAAGPCRSLKTDRFKERQRLPALDLKVEEIAQLPLPPEVGIGDFYRL